jgi:TolB-like protein/DNA-binding winged helix-turn-helix (wHTH) protein/Tfp pilus assembly protein PilF
MAQQVPFIYEFGPFRMDVGKRLLWRNEDVIALAPKCFDILQVLVEGQGKVISKDALMKRIWFDSFVEDNNLTYSISVLRKTLGERPNQHLYIVTLPGRGYQFAAEIKTVPANPEEVESESPIIPVVAQRSVKSQVVIAAAVIVAFSGTLFYWITARPKLLTESKVSAPVKSIAVLPFEMLGVEKNSETEFLSDGISESQINSLSQLPGLKVIARSSSFKYKGKAADPQEVARALGVETIVTGRILQRGDQLQISVELMDAREGTQIWGKQYNRPAKDLLAVQSEISGEIADNLRFKLTNAEQQQLAKRETGNSEAYELILRGRYQREKGRPENLKSAVELFKRAIAIDPSYALAHAELSIIYGLLSASNLLDPKEYLPQAEAEARQALALDANLADAHYAMANAEMNKWNWPAAAAAFDRALTLNPSLARARWRHALYLSIMGQNDQAIAEIERARELNPLSPRFKAYVSIMLLEAGRKDEAIQVLQNTLALDPNSREAQTGLGYAYLAKGMYAESINAYQMAIKSGYSGSSTQIYLGAAYARSGERNKALTILKRLQTSNEYVSPCELAVLYVALGQREEAFAALERAYAEHDLQLGGLGRDFGFDPIRSDPRFQNLMRRVGLPQ